MRSSFGILRILLYNELDCDSGQNFILLLEGIQTHQKIFRRKHYFDFCENF